MSCIVCGASASGIGTCLTPLRGSASVHSFLLGYDIISRDANCDSPSSDMELCSSCLSQVMVCDNLFCLLWRQVEDLKRKCTAKSVERTPVEAMDVEIGGTRRNRKLVKLDVSQVDSIETELDHDFFEEPHEESREDLGDVDYVLDDVADRTRRKRPSKKITATARPTAMCPVCNKTMERRPERMYLHIVTHHSLPEGKQCWDCGLSFITDLELDDHLAEHRREQLGHVACIHCRKVMPVNALVAHVNAHHASGLARTREERVSKGVKVERCLHCPFWCTTKEELELHQLRAHRDQHLKCVFCDVLYTGDLALLHHLRQVHLKKSVVDCSLCLKSYYSWKTYLAHWRRSHRNMKEDEFLESCSSCEFRSNPRSLRDHMQRVHGVVDKVEDVVKLIKRMANEHCVEEDADDEAFDGKPRQSDAKKRKATDSIKSELLEEDSGDEHHENTPRKKQKTKNQKKRPKVQVEESYAESPSCETSLSREPLENAEENGNNCEKANSNEEATHSRDSSTKKKRERCDTATCPVCSKTLHRRPDRMFHHIITQHSLPDGKRCWDCGLSFATDVELENHLAQHRQEVLDHVACIHCRKVMPVDALDAHVSGAHRSQPARTHKDRLARGVNMEKCPHCPFWCTTKEDWDFHQVRAHGDMYMKCVFCSVQYTTAVGLISHMRYVHLRAPIMSCSTCKKGFYIWKTYLVHWRRNHPEMNEDGLLEPCPHCEFRAKPRLLRDHVQQEHGVYDKMEDVVKQVQEKSETRSLEEYSDDELFEMPCPGRSRRNKLTEAQRRHRIRNMQMRGRLELGTCPDCGKYVSTKPITMYRHFQEAHGADGEGKRCWDCGRYFCSESELEDHLAQHRLRLLNRVACIHCRRVLMSPTAMAEHVARNHPDGLARTRAERVAAGVTVLKCKECPFWAPGEFEYEYHCFRAHNKRATYPCEVCQLECSSVFTLKSHMTVVHVKKPRYKCSTCGEEFMQTGRYKHHLRKHRDVVCAVCGVEMRRDKLEHHMRSFHTDKKVLQALCPECGKKIQKGNLANHLAAVHGIGERKKYHKTFTCSECGHESKSKQSHGAHLHTVHGQDVPYLKGGSCRVCGKHFSVQHQLKSHLKKMHGLFRRKFVETGLICTICGESAVEKNTFVEHLKNVHSLDLVRKNNFKEYVVMPVEDGEEQEEVMEGEEGDSS